MKTKQKIYPWLIVLAVGLLASVMEDTFTGMISLFLNPLVKSMGASLTVTSMYYTIINLSLAATMPLVGRFIEKINLTATVLIAILVGSGSIFLLSRSSNLWELYILAGIIGICCGFSGLVIQGIVINNWFEKRRNFAFTAASFVATIYLLIMTPATTFMIQSIGWRTTMLILAIIALMVGVPSALVIKLRPEKIDLKPYGFNSVNQENSEDNYVASEKKKDTKFSSKTVIFSGAFLIVLLFFVFIAFASNINQLFPTYASSVGFGATTGGIMETIMTAVDIVIAPIFAFTTDKFGGAKALPVWLLGGLLTFVLLIFATINNTVLFALLAAIFADILTDIYGPGQQIFARDMFGDAFEMGYSYVNTITYILAAFAVPLLSMIYDLTNTFNAVFMFGAVLVIGMILLVFIGQKNKFNKKPDTTSSSSLNNSPTVTQK